MAVMTCSTNWASPSESWTEYSFSGETKVRPQGPVNDVADLDIAYELAKQKADAQASANPDWASNEAEYDVFVRVVRRHRHGVAKKATA